MYPLIELGPLRLSSGGLALLAAAYLWLWLFERTAGRMGGHSLTAHAAACGLPALLGALVGARLWYGLLSLPRYAENPRLFLAFSLTDLAWPGAIMGGALIGWFCLHRRKIGPEWLRLADAAALALPLPMALGALGALLSGEAFGSPTALPWGIPLHGTLRHPTQLVYALVALLAWIWLRSRPHGAAGRLAAQLLLISGLLLIEPLRADALRLPGGLGAGQLFGLGLVLEALWFLRPAAAELEPDVSGEDAPA